MTWAPLSAVGSSVLSLAPHDDETDSVPRVCVLARSTGPHPRLPLAVLVKKHFPAACRPRLDPRPPPRPTPPPLQQARELAAHLHALRALCRAIMEKTRTTSDPLEERLVEPLTKAQRLDPGVAGAPGEASSSNGGAGTTKGKEHGVRNRILGIEGREALVNSERRCVVCLENVSRGTW